MQIDGGKNDKFGPAYADRRLHDHGHLDGLAHGEGKVAERTPRRQLLPWGLGGSSSTKCGRLPCAPFYPDAARARQAHDRRHVEPDGCTLKLADNSPKSAIDGEPKFVSDGNLTPDFYAVNTMQPPVPAEAAPDGRGWRIRLADRYEAPTLPPQTLANNRHELNAKGVTGPGMAAPGRPCSTTVNSTPSRPSSTIISRSTISPITPPARRPRARICADGGIGAARYARRSTPARCRTSPSTSRKAISTSTLVTPTSNPADLTSPPDRPSRAEPALAAKCVV